MVDRHTRYALFNRDQATTDIGAELLATARRAPWVATTTYAYVRSREEGDDGRQDAALTPRHSAGFVGMWEDGEWGRVGLEVYYTGRQRLEVNPYREESKPYVIVGLLVEKRIGLARLFLNAENVTNLGQTKWDSLLRPSRGIDGRWTRGRQSTAGRSTEGIGRDEMLRPCKLAHYERCRPAAGSRAASVESSVSTSTASAAGC